jgi:hypothetical protein
VPCSSRMDTMCTIFSQEWKASIGEYAVSPAAVAVAVGYKVWAKHLSLCLIW